MLATRSQLSIEFIILFAGVLVIFVVLFSTYFDKQKDLENQELITEGKSIVHEVAWIANAVYLQGYGANETIIIPTSLQGIQDYTLSVYNNSLWILYDGGSYSYPLLTQDVSLTYTKKSSFQLINTGTEVVIS